MELLRKTSFTLSIILVALGWRVAEPICGHPSVIMGYLLIVGGGVLFAASAHVLQSPYARPSWFALLTFAGTCLALTAQATYWMRPIYGCCAIAMLLLVPPRLRRNRLVMSFSIAAAVIMFCGASTILLLNFGWRLHDIRVPALNGTLERVLLSVGSSGGILTFSSGSGLEKIRLTFESLGIYELWYLGVVAAILAWFRRRSPGITSVTHGITVTLAYTAFRFLVLATLAIEFGESSIMWRPGCVVLSWLPLALVLQIDNVLCASPFLNTSPFPRVSRFLNASASPRAVRLLASRSRSTAIRCLLPICAGFLLAFGTGYNDPGHEKLGRIVIDETHANWEWTREPFDTTSLGMRAEYNYYCLRDYLSHFYSVAPETSFISRATLETTDVLIIKTPTEPFTDAETNAIVSFVKGGGSLLLIGDHTNLFGMSAYLNSIAQRFGMEFRYDDTFDLESSGFSMYKRPAIWFHPSLRHVDQFEFLTSCTIKGDVCTEPVMVGYGLGSEDVDYGHPNFFGNIRFDLSDRFGLFLQAAAKGFGRGRVLLFSDSTCFSNFCMFSPGKPELILGFVDYLNRQGKRHPYVRLGSLIASFVMLGLSCVVAGRHGIQIFPGLILGLFAVSHINASIYGPIHERNPISTVIFDTSHSHVSFFNYLGISNRGQSQQFEQFYMCAQRVGLFPRGGSIRDIESYNPSSLVIVNPSKDFSAKEVKIVREYVKGGGRLLVTDSVTNPASTANQVLAPFGIQLGTVPKRANLVSPPSRTRSVVKSTQSEAIVPVLYVYGPVEIKNDTGDNLMFAVTNIGRGKVIVATDSFCYSTSVLGPPLQRTTPQGQLLDIYRNIFALYAELMSPAPSR